MNKEEMESIKCSNPKCDNRGFVLFGKKWFCGECIIKVNKIITEKEEDYIMRKLQEC